MKALLAKLSKLVDVKSILTLCLTAVFCVQVLRGGIDSSDFQNIFLMVITFYFGTQSQKKKESTEVSNNQQ